MKDKFELIYVHMLFEEAGTIKFDLNEYIKFLKGSKKFDKNGNLIIEDKKLLIDVPDDLIKYCFENQNKIIKFETIKQEMKNSKHYQNIKNVDGNDLLFSIFNFNDDTSIRSFHYKLFEFNDLNEKINNDLFEKACDEFKKLIIESDYLGGFCGKYNNIYVICINEDYERNIERTIYHELSYYIQSQGNIRITISAEINDKKLDDYKNKKLNSIGINLTNLIYYFNRNEFSTHVDELLQGLMNTYVQYYQNKDINEFILSDIIQTFINDENILNSKLVLNYSKANKGDKTPLLMFIGSYYINHKYQKILYFIEQKLIKGVNR